MLTPLHWFFDIDSGEYVALAARTPGGPLVEVDRLPASAEAGGPGTLTVEVRGIRERAAAASVTDPDAAAVRDAVAGP